MATSLSMLTSLESLQLDWGYRSDQENRRPPPPTRSILPALTGFWFKGVTEYLEDLVSRIDAPRLYQLSTTLFSDIDFDIPELNRFISRTPTLGAYDEASLIFKASHSLVRLRQTPSHPEGSDHRMVEVKITAHEFGRHLSTLVKICTLPPLRPPCNNGESSTSGRV